jgi:CRP-like cAMP-binding protein
MGDTLWGSIFKKLGKNEIEKFLSENPLFEGLNSKEIKSLSNLIHLRKYKDGEIIFREGEPGVGLYIVMRGRVRIFKSVKEGNEITLAEFVPPQFFGEIAVIEGGPRTASAVAVGDTDLLGFFKADLMELIETNPRAGAKILLRISEILCKRLRNADREIARLSSGESK